MDDITRDTFGISKETFHQMDVNTKLDVLFDYATAANMATLKLMVKVDKLRDTSLKWGGVGGLIVGIMAYLGTLFVAHISK